MTSALVRRSAWLAIAVAAMLAAELRLRGEDGPVPRLTDDVKALESYRPGYRFWRNIFLIPDGSIAYGSAQDGRLLAVIPTKADWSGPGPGTDPAVAEVLAGVSLPSDPDDRRARVVELLEPIVGSVLHNPTRGNFLLPNAGRYGVFLKEWGAIYERFGVPADLGLAQAIIESGLSGTRRSEARAVGFCQWLQSNWKQLNRLSPIVIAANNQTTQAPYCAAYLTILATRYGSFIPALSDHHSGGVNVGRVIINGERLGGTDVRERYLLGSQLVRDLRRIDLYGYRDLYRTYGPRSYVYAEMVFGNMATVRALTESTPQMSIYAMRTPRAMTLTDIVRRTRLSADEVRRFNPALVKRVPAHSDLYLPTYFRDLGRDVSFWHRPPNAKYSAALADFLAIDAPPEHWDDGRLMPTLRVFERRFRDSGSEEGSVMATVLAYVMGDAESSGRREILAAFRDDEGLRELFNRALLQRVTSNLALLPCGPEPDREKGSC
jgi:hypothetical protein